MMFSPNDVRDQIVYASKSEGGFVSVEELSDNSFVLKDEYVGTFRFFVSPQKVEILDMTRSDWKYTIMDENALQEFINVVIYDIDPYLE